MNHPMDNNPPPPPPGQHQQQQQQQEVPMRNHQQQRNHPGRVGQQQQQQPGGGGGGGGMGGVGGPGGGGIGVNTTITNHNNNSSTAWFVNAPVTKVMIAFMIIFYIIVYNTFPTQTTSSNSNHHHHHNNVFQSIEYNSKKLTTTQNPIQAQHHVQSYRYLTSKCTFGSSTSTLLVGIGFLSIFYQKYEREMSSRTFLVYQLFILCCSIGIEYMINHILFHFINHNTTTTTTTTTIRSPTSPITIIYSGPYCFVGSIFYLYHCYSPRLYPKLVRVSTTSTIYFSEKAIYYLWFLYIVLILPCSSSSSSSSTTLNSNLFTSTALIPTCIGMMSCYLYLKIPNHLKKKFLDVPDWFVRLVQPITKQINDLPPPMLVPITFQHLNHQNNHNQVQQQQQQNQNPFQRRGGNGGAVQRRNQPFLGGGSGGGGNGGGGRQQLVQQPIPPMSVNDILQRLQEQHQQQQQQQMNDNNNNNNHTNPSPAQQQQQQQDPLQNDLFLPPPLATMEQVDPIAVEQLMAMGFPLEQVQQALRICHNNIEHAADRLLLSTGST